MKFLFVNDNQSFLRIWEEVFADHPEVVFAQCNSVDEAVSAIVKHQPDLVFLDHHLTPFVSGDGGHEGFKILEALKQLGMMEGRTIYTTTSDYTVLPQYEALGIKKASGPLFQAILKRDPAEFPAQFTQA